MSDAPIITLAREAGADVHHGSMGKTLHVLFSSRSQLERFAALAAAADRAAAQPRDVATLACAQAIRARGGNV